MWIRLTKPNGLPLLLNAAYIVQVTAVQSGGVQVLSAAEHPDENGDRKPKTYRATESLEAVFSMLKKMK